MADFPLIKELQRTPKEEARPLLPEGIKYEQYEIDAHDCGTMKVYVPLSEAQAFETAVAAHTVLVRSDVRKLLRTHRGIIGN